MDAKTSTKDIKHKDEFLINSVVIIVMIFTYILKIFVVLYTRLFSLFTT